MRMVPKHLFGEEKWTGMRNLQYKMQAIYAQQPKAVMIVPDPKSGFNSIEEVSPGIANYLGRSRSLEGRRRQEAQAWAEMQT